MLYRIAIWNRQKIVFGITMAIWMTDVGFLINGKYSLQIMCESLLNLVMLGIVQVNFQLELVRTSCAHLTTIGPL